MAAFIVKVRFLFAHRIVHHVWNVQFDEQVRQSAINGVQRVWQKNFSPQKPNQPINAQFICNLCDTVGTEK